MVKVKLKKLLLKKEEAVIIDDIISTLGISVVIKDEVGALLKGEENENTINKSYPVKVEDEIIGWVIGEPRVSTVASILTYLANNELEKKKLASETLDKYRELVLLYDLSEKIASSFDIEEVAELVMDEAVKHIRANVASVMLFNEETEALEIVFEVCNGKNTKTIVRPEDGIVRTVLSTGKAEIVNNILSDPRYLKDNYGVYSMICAPMLVKNRIIGVITIGNEEQITYAAEDLKLFNSIAFQAAVAIENAKLYTALEETFFETVKTLAETIEMRDPYTGGHTHRVTNYSMAIGKAMRLPENDLNRLKLAALMHDIGKIGIKDNILQKPAKLTDDEFIEMKKHTEFGADIVKNIKQLKDIVPGVRGHHERYDGLGYPDRLQGSEIPVIGRIIAVADSFDAMTTDRPYRKALDINFAFGELIRHSGTQFDPSVVDVFLKVYGGKKIKEIQDNRHEHTIMANIS